MNAKLTYPIVLVLAFIFAGYSASLQAQDSMGILWEVPDDSVEMTEQLSSFSEMGFSYLEMKHPVGAQALSKTAQFGFTVLIRTNNRFFREIDLQSERKELTAQYLQIADKYVKYNHVAGFGLLSQSQINQEHLETAFSPVLDTLSAQTNRSFYFVNGNEWFNFKDPNRAFGELLNYGEFKPQHLIEVNERHSASWNDSAYIHFYHSKWLLEAIEFYPPLAESINNYTRTGTWQLPMPNINEQKSNQHWLVLLLLFLWGMLAIQFKYLPYLRSMILRYFLAHRFYVDDILHYRERASGGGILMVLKHAIFGGMIFFIAAKLLVSEHGLEVFFHHFPLLTVFGKSYFSFLIMGSLIISVVEIISLFWLYLPAKNLNHISQSINLYAGLFYLDFFIATAIITLYSSNTGQNLILVLAALYIMIWISAFYLAAYNSSQSMGSRRVVYLLLTIGLHTAVLLAFILLILSNEYVTQTIDLAVSL